MWSHNFKWIIVAVVNLMLVGCILAAEVTCIKCDKTEDCLKTVTAIKDTCTDQSTCFTKTNDDGSISRGCLSTIKADDCTAKNCLTCTTNNCNNNNICKACDSSVDPKCAQTTAADILSNAICLKADTKCMISVLDSKTERGCITEDMEKKCTDVNKCKMCEGGICNIGIFPNDRISCQQCNDNSSNTNCATTNSETLLPCLLYVENDSCYMYGTDATHITRGCTSDVATTNKCTKGGDDKKCKTCNANNCNTWTYEMDATLKCIQCSSKDDPQCAWGQPASGATVCAKKILYTQEPKCYRQTDDTGLVTRGCLYDLDATAQSNCEANNTKCPVCSNANGCNNDDAKDFTCIRCRSDNDSNCLKDAKGIAGDKCTKLVTSDKDAKCFAGIWNNGLVIRGCYIDLEPRDQVTCNSSGSKCYVCEGANCNTKDPNSASNATNLLLSNGLLAVVIFTLWRVK